MSKRFTYSVLMTIFCINFGYAQKVRLKKEFLTAHLTTISFGGEHGKHSVRIQKAKDVKLVDEPTYAKVNNLSFGDGTIEVEVMGKLLADAPDSARAFIGIAFHINDDDTQFEGIYLRPTNAVSLNQVRRNRSTQYFSYPNFKFNHSRKNNPGEFESYADIAPDVWIKIRIVVKGESAQLYIGKNKNPSLIVNKMKMGADKRGSVGLWVDVGTDGFFRNLIIKKAELN